MSFCSSFSSHYLAIPKPACTERCSCSVSEIWLVISADYKMAHPSLLRPVVLCAAGQARYRIPADSAGSECSAVCPVAQHKTSGSCWEPHQVSQPVTRQRTGCMYLSNGGHINRKISSLLILSNHEWNYKQYTSVYCIFWRNILWNPMDGKV